MDDTVEASGSYEVVMMGRSPSVVVIPPPPPVVPGGEVCEGTPAVIDGRSEGPPPLLNVESDEVLC